MKDRVKIKELTNRTDEVLYYLWDPIGVSDEPCARGEYSSYALSIVGSVIKENKQEIANKLTKIEHVLMGLSANQSKNEEIAERLIQFKHAIEEGIK